MSDEDLALQVAAKMLLAKPGQREDVMRAEIPLDRFARVLPLLPVMMARFFDGFTENKQLRLGMQGILRTYLQQSTK
ncbi:hypothetical protein [Microbacterium sp. LWH13-1.2]|uniref:hypothetical protein n=1 Tax=Microbacterium sp. LWH13-1.2 TaxID=3135260 RepID=UPI003139467F